MSKRFALLAAVLFVSGCGQSGEDSGTLYEAAEADGVERLQDEPMEEAAAEPGTSGEIPAGQPQIAYTYDFSFRIPADRIAGVQEKHADICLKLGSNRCRIVSMQRDGSEGDYGNGTLQVAVAAGQARAFGQQLAEAVEGEGGEQTGASITGEDLSKQIVDTKARLRARRVLRDRLMEVLETRRGTVAELVEAERGVAQVNEEIDQAQSWLAEMRQRVAFSVMTIEYRSGTPTSGGFSEPIRKAVGSFGTIMGVIIGILITILAVAIPLAVVGGAIWFGWRFFKTRRREDDVEMGEDKAKKRQTARIS